MLSMAHYLQTYIDACREKVERHVDAYEELAIATAGGSRMRRSLRRAEVRVGLGRSIFRAAQPTLYSQPSRHANGDATRSSIGTPSMRWSNAQPVAV